MTYAHLGGVPDHRGTSWWLGRRLQGRCVVSEVATMVEAGLREKCAFRCTELGPSASPHLLEAETPG